MSDKSTPSTSGKDSKMSGQFTPANSAIVLIDHQVGTLQFVYTMSPDELYGTRSCWQKPQRRMACR